MYINKLVAVITILFIFGVCTSFAAHFGGLTGNNIAPDSGFPFQLTIEVDGETHTLEGQAELSIMPSMYTIIMNQEDVGRCVLHMINFTQAPGVGTYEVTNTEVVRTAMICISHVIEPTERLASRSGTFNITALTREFITGDFDMMLAGPISGKEFRVKGSLKAENLPVQTGPGQTSNPFMRQ
jgi:hypothetical protein